MGALLSVGLLLIAGFLSKAYVIMCLWNWFIVDLTKFNTMNMYQSVGLTLFSYIFSYNLIKQDTNNPFELFLSMFIPWAILIVAYCFK